MTKIFKTLSCYEKIFRVEINEETKTAEIYAEAWEELIPKKLNLKTVINFERAEHIMSLYYEEYRVGSSYYDSLDMSTVGSDKLVVKKCLDTSYIGNSLLFRVDKEEYIYIGHLIGKIIIKDKVLDYVSPVYKGNSYPYIIGEKNVYLLTLCSYISKQHFKDVDLNLPQNYAANLNLREELKCNLINNKKNQTIMVPDYIEYGVPPLK